MLIIPAIDLLNGKCVRLAQGDYAREKVYDADPISVAKGFEQQGAEWIHIVDLDGARSGEPINLPFVSRIAVETKLRVEFGGGVRSRETIDMLLNAGVERIVIGTKLIQDHKFAEATFQSLGERAVAGIDARDERVATGGWTQTSDEDVVNVSLRVEHQGARRIILTDIARDGMLTGPNLSLLERVQRTVSIPIVQSGGVSNLLDLQNLMKMGRSSPEAVIIGRALYEGTFTLAEALNEVQVDSAARV